MDRNLALFQHLALSPGDNLAHAALAAARLEYPDLDLSRYLEWFDRQGAVLAALTQANRSVVDRIYGLNDFFYKQEGFTPNTQDYYDPRNSYLNDVIERRTGIPISLAITYMELARHLSLKLQGVGFPGHFLIRNAQTTVFYIDAFQFGQILLREDCESRFTETTGGHLAFSDEYLKPASEVEILVRMLGNLKNIFVRQNRPDRAVETLNWIIAIQPETPLHFRDRGLLLARVAYPEAAVKDLQHYLDCSPFAQERPQIESLLTTLRSSRTTVH
ncbi:MAG: tetratricopeptide repeat protein [Acidobacteria bacterium]|nr:tetratricopeptide repeat protein [Acidobacteriota bacterium]